MNIKLKWNTKHLDRMRQMAEPIPNPRLMKHSAYLTGGTGLDLACGLGGNSLFLAEKNYQVQAMDLSDVAIAYIRDQAEKKTDTMHLLSNG